MNYNKEEYQESIREWDSQESVDNNEGVPVTQPPQKTGAASQQQAQGLEANEEKQKSADIDVYKEKYKENIQTAFYYNAQELGDDSDGASAIQLPQQAGATSQQQTVVAENKILKIQSSHREEDVMQNTHELEVDEEKQKSVDIDVYKEKYKENIQTAFYYNAQELGDDSDGTPAIQLPQQAGATSQQHTAVAESIISKIQSSHREEEVMHNTQELEVNEEKQKSVDIDVYKEKYKENIQTAFYYNAQELGDDSEGASVTQLPQQAEAMSQQQTAVAENIISDIQSSHREEGGMHNTQELEANEEKQKSVDIDVYKEKYKENIQTAFYYNAQELEDNSEGASEAPMMYNTQGLEVNEE